MEIFFIILIMIVIYFVGKVAWGARVPSGQQFTDEEIKTMTNEKWRELSIETIRNTGIDVLRVHLRQYEDLKKRVEEKHPQTMELLDEQGIRRSLESLEHTREELRRRKAL